jgi:hypothetical protein
MSLFELWVKWNSGFGFRSENRGWSLYIPKKMKKTFEKKLTAIREEEETAVEEGYKLWDQAETCKKCNYIISPENGLCRCHTRCKVCKKIPDEDLWWCDCTPWEEIKKNFCRSCGRYDPDNECGCRGDLEEALKKYEEYRAAME